MLAIDLCSMQPYAITVRLCMYTEYLTQYCAGGKIETNEKDRACGAYGGG
jgi:hypothetical protein